MFQHYLITHFNLLNITTGVNDIKKWTDWTKDRIQLFKRFCLPSIINQTNKNFTWLLYFDKQTPQEFQFLFEELTKYSFIKVLFADGLNGFMDNYVHDIKLLAGNTNWIITSRIDNDDCFHKDAIQVIQNYFVESDEHIISLASGYTYTIQTNTLSHYYYPMSPFISLIEKSNKHQLKGIYFVPHSEWSNLRLHISKELFKKNKTVTFVLEKPYWLQVIHGVNISNSSTRGLPVFAEKKLQDFGIDVVTKGQSFMQIFTYYDYVHWKRYLKASIVKLLTNKSLNRFFKTQ